MDQPRVRSSSGKARRDLHIAEAVYYTIGGIALVVGIIFSILGVVILNPVKQNFSGTYLVEFEQKFFAALKWKTTFMNAGLLLMVLAAIYFLIVFSIFAKKGDEVDKKTVLAKSRQRQVVFTAPVQEAPTVTDVAVSEAKEEAPAEEESAPAQENPEQDK